MNFKGLVCPICSGENFKKIFFMKEICAWNQRRYSLYKCLNCKNVRPFPLPYLDKNKLKIYGEENISFYENKERKILFESKEYLNYLKHFKEYNFLFKKYHVSGKLLDVGCGSGHLLMIAEKNGLSVEGLEVSKEQVRALSKRFKVSNLNLEEIKKKYDVLTMNHVLEHIENPKKFVNSFSKRVKKGGFVIIAVPYFWGVLPQILRTRWYGTGRGQHLNFYSIKSFKILFKKKFDILEIKRSSLDYSRKYFPKKINNLILFISKLIGPHFGDNIHVVLRKK